jgi:uncharacterized damage-inducible protein DinB
MDPAGLRKQLVELLEGGHAHVPWRKALAGVAQRDRAASPGPGQHTLWELLEHLRIAQEDILRYTLSARWRSPRWPDGYWPRTKRPTAAQWRASVAAFGRDLGEVVALARDPARDLTARIPHGEGRTYLRQLLLVADHNAYHLGQFVATRRLLGNWK